jgi:hypothetical protein
MLIYESPENNPLPWYPTVSFLTVGYFFVIWTPIPAV